MPWPFKTADDNQVRPSTMLRSTAVPAVTSRENDTIDRAAAILVVAAPEVGLPVGNTVV